MEIVDNILCKKSDINTLIIIILAIIACILLIIIIPDAPLNNLPTTTPTTSPTMESTTIPTGTLLVTGEYDGLGSLTALVACFCSLIVFCSYKGLNKKGEMK